MAGDNKIMFKLIYYVFYFFEPHCRFVMKLYLRRTLQLLKLCAAKRNIAKACLVL